jgi:cytochrome c-type biogenesis protein CcmF
MRNLASYYLPGALALWCALAFGLVSLWGYVQLLRGDESARPFARRGYRLFALSMLLVALVMVVALARRDFRLDYVFQYSGMDLPLRFQVAAFWAGQKGSFLIWLLWGALLGVPLIHTTGKQEGSVMGVYLMTQLGILLILVRENPFLMLDHAPTDGQGLNPLLQDPWMVIHPPIMFVGYAASAIPFAFAMSALFRRDTSEWAARAFPWALGGFLILGTAILLGGYWAYKTLGWGGYWGWDPVENASLIPWLFGTALIHGLYLERTRGRYRRANLVLATLVYLSVLYGTFLTRSGVLADFSVHSFVDLGISGWLIALMAFFIALSGGLLILRLRSVETAPNEDPPLSRGTFLVLSTISLVTCAIVVTIGTSAPLLTRFLPNPGQVGPEFYNRVNFPIAVLIALLLSMVPYLTWKGEASAREVARKLAVGAGVALGATALAVVLGVRQPLHLAFIFLASTAASTNLQKTIGKARAGGLAAAGGYLAHVGVGVILLGILASSAYDSSVKVTLEQGKPQRVEDLTLTFHSYLPRTATERERMEVAVVRDDGTSYLAYPQLFVNDRTQQLMAHPHIRNFAFADLYLSPLEYDPGRPAGGERQIDLAKGESVTLGGRRITFQGFDLNVEGNALAKMTSGQPVAIGALLQVESAQHGSQVEPIYRFTSGGQVESQPLPLPGGGQVAVGAIQASTGSVSLLLAGVDSQDTGKPPQLALDVTRKPLIRLVWWGIYVVLLGGILALVHRARQVARLGQLTAGA